jgi:4-diphosphocytidyl-2-C-methyl-D-erythritol kinase
MILRSHAKINLILKVFDKSKDLHPIVSVMDKIELHDKLIVNTNKSGNLAVKFLNAKIDKMNNTVMKALILLKEETKFKQGIIVEVIKNIPLASGLGGGSSNAAVVLKYLNEKLKLNLSTKKLNTIAFKVGSDVPSFLVDGPVLISGHGEKVLKVELPSTSSFLIVKPKFGVSAKQAYQFYDKLKKSSNKMTSKQVIALIQNENIYNSMTNDLQLPVLNNVASLNKLHKHLNNYNFDKVIMTGSGSAFIAFSSNKNLLVKAKKELSNKYDFVVISKRLKTR